MRGHGQTIRRHSSGGGDPDTGAGRASDPDQAAGMNPWAFGSPPARASRRIFVDGVWCHLAFVIYGLENGERKIAHRYRDNNVRLDQARQ